MYKLYSYNGMNKQLVEQSECIAELVEKGIAFNCFMCALNEITSKQQWINYLNTTPHQRYFVEADGGMNVCYPDILGE